MIFETYSLTEKTVIYQLFKDTFTQSDGVGEGEMVSALVKAIVETTAPDEHIGIVAKDGVTIVASIFLSHLNFNTDITAFLLSPVVVSAAYQGQGLGQKIIHVGLEKLKEQQADLVFTYGDPKYYGKVGFEVISESQIQAPYSLQFPEGWLCQSLTTKPIPTITETPTCVSAFRQPEIW